MRVEASALLEMRLTGEGVALGTLPAREWLGVVDALLAALQSGGGPEAVLAITGIGEGSVVVPVRVLSGNVSLAWQAMREALEGRTVYRLSGVAREGVETAIRFTRKYRGRVEFRQPGGTDPVAIIDPETSVMGPGILRESTVLYGRVYRVGGAEPKIGLEVDPDGARIACGCTVELAQRVAPLLYQRVGLYGEAKWDPEAWSLVEFDAKDLSEFRETPLQESLSALAAIVGEDHWGEDVVGAVKEIRREGP